jgi:hypothetical protein
LAKSAPLVTKSGISQVNSVHPLRPQGDHSKKPKHTVLQLLSFVQKDYDDLPTNNKTQNSVLVNVSTVSDLNFLNLKRAPFINSHRSHICNLTKHYYHLMGCNAAYFRKNRSNCEKNIVPPSFWLKTNPVNKPARSRQKDKFYIDGKVEGIHAI